MTVWIARGCGCTYTGVMGAKRPRICDAHGNIFQSEKALAQSNPATPRKGSGLKRTQRRESAAEKRARLHFNETVKAWPCWFKLHRPCDVCGGEGQASSAITGDRVFWCSTCDGTGQHVCSGRKDAHHLVPKSFLRQRFEAVLPEEEFVAILFNPKIGAPLCRKAHDAIESGRDRICWEDLSDDCIEYVSSLPDFVLMRLELESPKRASSADLGAAA
jgi:hypothetical protein